jgi:tetratricopeptide (TPR) repeat protein
MGVSLLQMEKYQEAFNAFKRAKELLPTDNNGLTEGNKGFLKESLEKFDKEGEKWRKTGSIDTEEKETLKSLIKSFESSFNRLYTGEASLSVSDARALKSEVLQIVNLVYEDKFALLNIDRVFELVKQIFHDDDCFHIIPQLFIQHFWNSNFI